MTYILSLGTNIGDRKANIEQALDALSLLPETTVTRRSRLYETEPVGYADQQAFYNLLAEVESGLDPHEMLGACLGIEAAFGRVRTIKNGPRILDLDVILVQGYAEESVHLTVPHPRYTERRFILQPLLDLFPDDPDTIAALERIEGQKVTVVNS